MTTNYATLITEAAGCSEFLDLAASQTALLDTGLTSLTDDLLEEFDALNTESLSELADDVSTRAVGGGEGGEGGQRGRGGRGREGRGEEKRGGEIG